MIEKVGGYPNLTGGTASRGSLLTDRGQEKKSKRNLRYNKEKILGKGIFKAQNKGTGTQAERVPPKHGGANKIQDGPRLTRSAEQLEKRSNRRNKRQRGKKKILKK